MKMKKILFALLVLVASAGLVIGQHGYFSGSAWNESTRFVPAYVAFDDETPGEGSLIGFIYYIGTQNSGTVDLNAGNLELHHGALAAEVADTNIVVVADAAHASCGVTAGIDLAADTACDTWGEVADIVNASTNWRMVLVGVLRTDATAAAGANLIDPADGQARTPKGLPIYEDSSAALDFGVAIRPDGDVVDETDGRSLLDSANRPADQDLWDKTITYLYWMRYIYDDGDNDDAIVTVYSVELDGDYTETTIFQVSAAADGTYYTKDITNAAFPVFSKPGEKLLIKISSANLVATDDNFLRVMAGVNQTAR
jgi:hypothetical protein